MDLLGWILAGLAGAAVIGLVVYGVITKQKIKEQLAQRGIRWALVNAIDTCDNIVSLTDLDSKRSIEIRGNGVSNEINENDIITVQEV